MKRENNIVCITQRTAVAGCKPPVMLIFGSPAELRPITGGGSVITGKCDKHRIRVVPRKHGLSSQWGVRLFFYVYFMF